MLINKQTTKCSFATKVASPHYCDHCGNPIAESLIMVDGFYKYNSLSCANCTDYDEYEDGEEDYDQPTDE